MAGVRRIAGAVLLFLLCVALYTTSALAESDRRHALVIGNGDYRHVLRLANPARDASDMADTLADLGFEVTLGLDLDRQQFERLVSEFRAAAAEAAEVVFYYSGHGFQLNGLNRLVPVDAALRSRSRIDAETLVLDEVIGSIHGEGRQTVVFLDACRDNPLPPSLQERTSSGLAAFQAGHDDIFISLATEPGRITWDGDGRNSPFTRALLTHITRPQQSIFDLMMSVRNEVLTETLEAQVPWYQSYLRSQFYFNPAPRPDVADSVSSGKPGIVLGPASPAAVDDKVSPPADTAAEEEMFWGRVAQSGQAADLRSYLETYPAGRFATQAYDRLAALAAAEAEAQRAAEEERLWTRAAQSGQAADLRSYLETYPAGRFATQAYDRLATLAAAEAQRAAEAAEEERLWTRAAQSGQAADLQSYLDTYPAGRFAAEANDRLTALAAAEAQRAAEAAEAAEEERLWTRAAQSGQAADLQSYLETYPDGRFAAEANDRLTALAAAEAEAQRAAEEASFWTRAAASGQAADLQSYLETYPDGRFVAEANDRLTALAKAETEAERAAEEERLWSHAAQSGQAADLQSYLETYPDGRFTPQANDRLAALAPAEPSPGTGDNIAIDPGLAVDGLPETSTDTGEEEAQSPTGRELVIALQEVLQQLGCYSGSIDGVWGRRSREGMEQVLQHAQIADSPEPSFELLTKIKSVSTETPVCAARAVKPRAPRQPAPAQVAAPRRQPAPAKAAAPPRQPAPVAAAPQPRPPSVLVLP